VKTPLFLNCRVRGGTLFTEKAAAPPPGWPRATPECRNSHRWHRFVHTTFPSPRPPICPLFFRRIPTADVGFCFFPRGSAGDGAPQLDQPFFRHPVGVFFGGPGPPPWMVPFPPVILAGPRAFHVNPVPPPPMGRIRAAPFPSSNKGREVPGEGKVRGHALRTQGWFTSKFIVPGSRRSEKNAPHPTPPPLTKYYRKWFIFAGAPVGGYVGGGRSLFPRGPSASLYGLFMGPGC